MRTNGQTLRLGALTLEWGQRTFIMGVLNVTPDSFSGDGVDTGSEAVDHARQMLADGADVIDVGGESTRPGADPVPLAEELRRVVPVVQALVRDLGAVVSIDTQKAEVARQGLDVGATMINDVSALRTDPAMATVIAA
ncbi:MAG TPA: dihydropteroate synthase, partial [bacterium]|nr:dihydropteroate synthase [bacterium]